MPQQSDRHAMMEQACLYCGELFWARVERVNKGQGRFCSLKHANLYVQEHPTQLRGFENGKKYWNGEYWIVRWYDEKGGQHTTSYPKWWWTLHKGEVPAGYVVVYKDGNPENINPRNFALASRKAVSAKYGARTAGVPRPNLAGPNSKWWKGGSSYDGYPTQFSKPLKRRIKIRDEYTCQCCFSIFDEESGELDVHHIDSNRKHNTEDNLVSVCKSCHKAIHGKMYKVNDGILKYQALLPD